MKVDELREKIEGGLIVSCQALPGEPLYRPEGGIMPLMALAAWQAGAVAIRANGLVDIEAIKKTVPLPVIGLIKHQYEGYGAYITPTFDEVDALVSAGSELVAVDATVLSRPHYESASFFIEAIKKKYPDQLVLADCATYEDALRASEAGADFVSTTMSGYVNKEKGPADGPDFELAEKIASSLSVPLIAEGRIHSPDDAVKMLSLGALAVVVGGAITRPREIAESFTRKINSFRTNGCQKK